MKKIFLIIIIYFISSCMNLYSYPTDGQARQQRQQNMQMPPDFSQQMMQQMNRPLISNPTQKPLEPNSIKKYPDNVPYPYGMQKRYEAVDDDQNSIRQLESLPKQQYRGDYHYRSIKSSQHLNE